MFVLLPAAAWAWVISADNLFFYDRLNPLNRGPVAGRLSGALGSLLRLGHLLLVVGAQAV
jgi:hypothetical protein